MVAIEIVPIFGLIGSIQNDNGPLFVSHAAKGITRALGLKQTMYLTWQPQLSEKVEIQSELQWLLIALICLMLASRNKLKCT